MHYLVYEEVQRFRNLPWFWVIVSIPPVLILFMISVSVIPGDEVTRVLLSLFLGYVPVLLILYSVKYRIVVDSDGLHYQFLPVLWRYKTITAAEIQSVILKETTFIDRVHIGHRYNPFSNVTRMNITGNKFICLTLKNRKKILLGTGNAEALLSAIQNLMLPQA
jgi:hypothetical protein